MEDAHIDTRECLNACPVCCDGSVAEINAKNEGELRKMALVLSSVVAVIVLSAHIWFAWTGKVFPIPDIAWALILAPWLGAAIGKLTPMLVNKNKK